MNWDPDVGRPAVLVVDMQEGFRDVGAQLCSQLNKLTALAREKGAPVFFSQHGHTLDDDEVRTSILVRHWGLQNCIRYGSKEWQLLSELNVDPDRDSQIEKATYDMFQGTRLEELLREHGRDTVIVCGVMTNSCCECTARSAFCKNFEVKFLSDGTATETAEMHAASLLNIGFDVGEVTTCAEVMKRLRVYDESTML